MNWKDAVEFMLAELQPFKSVLLISLIRQLQLKVAEGIDDYLDRHGYKSVKEINRRT